MEIRSVLRAPAAEVWAHASSMEGVNAELAPWMRMSVPPSVRGQSIADVQIGEVAFHSWLLAFGFVPIDRHALRLIEVGPMSFREHSSSILQRAWKHDRTVRSLDDGCEVVDRVSFEPRLPLGAIATPIVSALFRHRHAKLRELFG